MTSPSEDYRLIPLTRGQFAKIDAADFERLSAFKWFAAFMNNDHTAYVVRKVTVGTRKQKTIWMHREVVGINDSRLCVDHINGDCLDNRRDNLRVATKSQHACNRGATIKNTSGFKGVKRNGRKWRACVNLNGERHEAGTFDTAEEAHRAYCAKARELHGDFARDK